MAKQSKTAEMKRHMAAVAELGCQVKICDDPRVELNHVSTGAGMGRKNNHFMCFGLCLYHHRGPEGLHQLGTKAWEEKYGSQMDLLLQAYHQLGYDEETIERYLNA